MSAIAGPSRANQFFSAASQQVSAFGGRAFALLPTPVMQKVINPLEKLFHERHLYSPLQKAGVVVVALATLVTATVLTYKFFKFLTKNLLIAIANIHPHALGGRLGKSFDGAFLDDQDVAKHYPECFEHLSRRLQDKDELAFIAVEKKRQSFAYVSDRLQNDFNFAKRVVAVQPICVRYFHLIWNLELLKISFESPMLEVNDIKPILHTLWTYLRYDRYREEPYFLETWQSLIKAIDKFPSSEKFDEMKLIIDFYKGIKTYEPLKAWCEKEYPHLAQVFQK